MTALTPKSESRFCRLTSSSASSEPAACSSTTLRIRAQATVWSTGVSAPPACIRPTRRLSGTSPLPLPSSSRKTSTSPRNSLSFGFVEATKASIKAPRPSCGCHGAGATDVAPRETTVVVASSSVFGRGEESDGTSGSLQPTSAAALNSDASRRPLRLRTERHLTSGSVGSTSFKPLTSSSSKMKSCSSAAAFAKRVSASTSSSGFVLTLNWRSVKMVMVLVSERST
mmetsp:Transcript_43448/g.143783  ORF Transcript_43448/g.143783 Transcript_43448/m.143783 type:complete len:227 (-) Transcript_43448:3156-3836(-)